MDECALLGAADGALFSLDVELVDAVGDGALLGADGDE